jgi:nucleotide-binding universal stress UspA family protein
MTTKRSRTPQTTVRRILVPVDFFAASLHAASFAFALARQLGCEVRCTTVVDVLDLRIAMRAGLHDFETNADLRRQVGRWINGEFGKLTAIAGMDVQREVRRGVPEHEILKSVRKPDIIVMGSIGIARRFPLEAGLVS